jgi:predicted Rossmann fold flavoprotein
LPALEAFGSKELREMLAGLGVATTCPDGLAVYPASQRAGDVLNALVRHCHKLGVELRTGVRAARLRMADGFVEGVQTDDGTFIPASAVILACGGRGYPSLGGSPDGCELARQAGHEIITPTPALVSLDTVETWGRSCAGLAVSGTVVCIDLPRRRRSETGDIIFTHRGLSGPAVLDLSGDVAELLGRNQTVPLSIQWQGGVEAGDWRQRLDSAQRTSGRKLVSNVLGQWLPRRLAEALCAQAGCGQTKAAELPSGLRDTLTAMLGAARMTVNGTGGFERAMVTRGGVSLKGVNPRTMASRRISGLFLAGELLDLDGPCGGFNLQWAFSSGHLAGLSAAGVGQ